MRLTKKKLSAIFICVLLLSILFSLAYTFVYPSWLVSRFLDHNPASSLRRYALSLKNNGQSVEESIGDRNKWPASFVEFGADDIVPYIDGILIIILDDQKTRHGVFVSTESDEDLAPYDGSGITFHEVAEGVFSFEEKMREPK